MSNLSKTHDSKVKNNFNLKVFENFSLPLTSKGNLASLILSEKILEITKVIKTKNGSFTLLAKINLNLKAFSKLSMETDEVVIKVLPDSKTKFYELQSYTKNPSNTGQNSKNIGSFFIRESFTIFTYRNVIVMKKFQNAKTLSEILKGNSEENLVKIFGEILQQIHDIRFKDESFWKLKVDPSKKIVHSNEKWIFINPTDAAQIHSNYFIENISLLIELFQLHGVSENDLRIQFSKVMQVAQWSNIEWKRKITFVIMRKYFTPIENVKISRKQKN